MKRILIAFACLGLGLLACNFLIPSTPTPTPLPTFSPAQRQTRVLAALLDAVKEQYIYSDFGGINLDGLRAEYESKIQRGLTSAEFEAELNALVAKLPEDSAIYRTRAERIEIEMSDTALYSGIGAYISVRTEPEPHIVIMSIIAGSPAAQAGLRAHDSIYGIDGQPVTAEEGLEVVQRVRGEAGTKVEFEVASPNSPRRKVTVTRAKLTASDTFDYTVDNGVIYFRLPVTPDATFSGQLTTAMQLIASQPELQGIILDLRVARGASADWPLDAMLAYFGNGRLGEFYSRTKTTPVEVEGVNAGGSQKLPLVILVGPDTEGFPEILAAALQEAGRATVVGLPTGGRIFGYNTIPLPDGSNLTLAVTSYKTQSGRDLGESGVKPDVEMKEDWDQVNPNNDPLLKKALEIILKK